LYPQLLPDFVGLDQRSLAELIAEMRTIARNIPYTDKDENNMGNWQQFLDGDILFFLVSVMEFSTDHFEHQLKNKTEEELLQFLWKLIQTIDQWYRKSLLMSIESLSFELENAIKNQLKKIIHLALFDEAIPLHKLWKETTHSYKPSALSVTKQIGIFLNTIKYIQGKCHSIFEVYEQKKEISQPHTALALSFLKLFGHIQKRFNKTTLDHVNYYYNQLLKQSKTTSQPERTQVFFHLAKEATEAFIPEKTLLQAGMEEDGEEILFETTERLEVSKTEICDLTTLYVAGNPLISPHNALGLVTGIYQDKINSVLDLNAKNAPRSLFGEDAFISNASQTSQKSEVGWAISGPIFLLKEGTRKLTIDFHIDKNSLSSFQEQIQQLSNESELEYNAWIHRFFHKTFHVSFTSDGGWFAVTNFLSTLTETTSTYLLTISFSLNVDDPSISSFQKEIHQGDYESPWPIIRIVLNNNNAYYPYSFLRDALINSIHTKVEVEELQEISVFNSSGQQDITQPFPLFGIQPGKAASCYIGHDEWRYKMLTSVNLELHWHQIDYVNFKDIYQHYPEKITREKFLFDVATLSNRTWKKASRSMTQLPLFHADGKLIHPITSIQIDDEFTLDMVPDLEQHEMLELQSAKNGFFRLQITHPSFGFGHGIYESLVNKTVQEIAKNPKKARKKNIQIPQLPFVPEAEKIKVSYSAEQDFILHDKDGRKTDKRFPFTFFHIHPFGLMPQATQKYTKSRRLLPYFEDKGYLYIGFKGLTPLEKLSIYIKKLNDYSSSTHPIEWEYLHGESWKSVPSTFLQYDGTHNFQHSGFIHIQVPGYLEHHHPLFAQNLSWFRISTQNTTAPHLGKILCIQLNGVDAIRRPQKNQTQQTAIDKINSITSTYTSIPEILSVTQPFIPTGGVQKEKSQEFYTRVSERLFHKKRGITPSDFELLVLEAFPQVYQACCFPSTMFPQNVPPGTIKLMVLPLIYEDTPVGDRMLSSFVLQKIRTHLLKLGTGCKSLEVLNPNYETIRVSCAVQFQEEYEAGQALQLFKKAINRFIAPWILTHNEISKTKKNSHQIIHPSSLLSALLSLPEVKSISGLSLVQFHKSAEDGTYTFIDTAKTEALRPTKPWSVFVPSEAHHIRIIRESEDDIPSPLHIGTMTIQNDFILKNEKPYESN
jgi:hypothetical protein